MFLPEASVTSCRSEARDSDAVIEVPWDSTEIMCDLWIFGDLKASNFNDLLINDLLINDLLINDLSIND
jgi:hypothetical protein